jgi:isopropylmalate/homocitrate/citramalate synthase
MVVGKIQIVEVGARDGLQNETVALPTVDKIELISRLVAAGVSRLEVASFVHPGLVPQMADAEAVVAGLPEAAAASRIGLVLNERGLDRALATNVDEINFVVGASEGFNRANQNAAITETMAAITSMLPIAIEAGRKTTVTISVAFGCPYDGEVPVGAVVDLAQRSVAAGAGEIALGDTIGVAVPSDVAARVAAVGEVTGEVPSPRLRREYGLSMHRWEVPEAVRMRRMPPATWLPRMWFTPCTEWATAPISISTGSLRRATGWESGWARPSPPRSAAPASGPRRSIPG